MKKILALCLAFLLMITMVSCDSLVDLLPFLPNADDSQTDDQGGDNQSGDNQGSDNQGSDNQGSDNQGSDNQGSDNQGSDNQGSDNQGSDNQGSDNQGGDNNQDDVIIGAVDAIGGNEMIKLAFTTKEGYSYEVYYRPKDATDYDYVQLDRELMISDGDRLNCYVLGISAGTYKAKIEATDTSGATFSITLANIEVSAQDRSGYAHFGAANGVGAYNNDGTVKSGTKIIYVTNENKNTVTCEINGTEYVGLVNILQAQYKSSTPMLIRVIGKISTNQWNYKNVEPRLSDGSNATDDFFENTFSDEYGENLANLIVKMNDKGNSAKTYNYKTTAEGLSDVRTTGSGSSTTTYKGSDFPDLKGSSVYDDDSYYNMLEVKGSANITIEGVGEGAEFFQFGISFEECNSIEIKNITFTDYPEDALNFMGGDREDLASYSRYWIHNCTFNRGKNNWDISGERDKSNGDGSVDFNNVSNVTLAYNFYNQTHKTMLFGNGDSQACMNMTMHHNYFYKVGSRLPLGRNVNIHSYNNYFEGCSNCIDVRKNSYVFSENNYYKSVSKPFILSSSKAKSFGDIFDGCTASGITKATSRTQTVSATCKPDNATSLANFDTSSELFYYDSENERSAVSIMNDAADVPDFVKLHAGAGKFEFLGIE